MTIFLFVGIRTGYLPCPIYVQETYDYLIRLHTTTNMTADGIHELGKDEVDRITAKMEKIKEQIGFTAELKDFFELVRTKEDLMPFHNPEVVMIDFNGIHERMSAHLDSVFQLRLKAGFQIKRTEAFREASASAEYVPSSKNPSVLELYTWPYPTLKLIT